MTVASRALPTISCAVAKLISKRGGELRPSAPGWFKVKMPGYEIVAQSQRGLASSLRNSKEITAFVDQCRAQAPFRAARDRRAIAAGQPLASTSCH